ncbi:MAG: Fic family protein [Anaeroplasmataceae bacterium]
MKDYIKVSEAAKRWNLSSRRVRILCSENKIYGVIRIGNLYMIPIDTPKPIDGRRLRGKTQDYTALFNGAQSKKEELDKLRPLTKGELHRLSEQFMVDYTYNSNAIEGNTLTLKETSLVLQGITIDQKPLKDHLEVVGHKDAFTFVEDIAKKDIRIDEFLIKQIHSLVLINSPEDKGVYRKIPVQITGAFTDPIQPHLIEDKMKDLLIENAVRKKTMHPIERIARFHLEFEGIHPFIDGNGRTGRLLMNLDLMREGYPPINIKFTDRKKYYNTFDAFFKDNDPKPIIELIAGYVMERLDEYLIILKN